MKLLIWAAGVPKLSECTYNEYCLVLLNIAICPALEGCLPHNGMAAIK
jgi:hypothetical protein